MIQKHRSDQSQHRGFLPLWTRWTLIGIVFLTLVIGTVLFILSSQPIWGTIIPAVFTFAATIFTLLQLPILFHESETHRLPQSSTVERTTIPISDFPTMRPQSSPIGAITYRSIIGLPHPTDPRIIEQREKVVEEVYQLLIQQDITAIALTGMGGVGKSTLAALVSSYVEKRRRSDDSPFGAETLWLTLETETTMFDLTGTILAAINKSLPKFEDLTPHNQARKLFDALNEAPARLVILDQFEYLLDIRTGQIRRDRPGIEEWLDLINTHPCTCRFLLVSRIYPKGTHGLLPKYLREYVVKGLDISESKGILDRQGVEGTEEEIQRAVDLSEGNPLVLSLMASAVRENHINLTTLLEEMKNVVPPKKKSLGDILNDAFSQLNQWQRSLLLTFSVFREPIPLDAALAVLENFPDNASVTSDVGVLLDKSLLDTSSEGRYQLHPLVADYAQEHFVEDNEKDNSRALQEAHVKAANYYLRQTEMTGALHTEGKRSEDMHMLVEAIWHLLQADQTKEAYQLAQQENILQYLLTER